MHVIGTAGHVDHGKSSLVLALTGIDPDRLKEEKEREMTIDLGFAWMKSEDGQEEIGIVDVPGHRDFIENMLAGMGGIDLALMVIAADEGVMPQTEEHLAIIDLLEISRGIIALTKIDLVDDEDWVELVTLEIGETVAGTVMEDAPVVAVSAATGAGLLELKDQIFSELKTVEERANYGQPRLPIDRVFSLTGFGTIVTGTLLGGQLSVGQAVQVQPADVSGRIRGLQTHKTKIETAQPGSRVAINLSGIDKKAISRGDVVALPGALDGTILCDVSYVHLQEAKEPLLHNQEVKFFSGAAEVVARTRVIGEKQINPGARAWLQLAFREAAALQKDDHYILRRPSPTATIGGGMVLDPHPGRRHKRFKDDVTARFETLDSGRPSEIILQALSRNKLIEKDELITRSGLSLEEGSTTLVELLDSGQVRQIESFYITSNGWDGLGEGIVLILESFHSNSPLRSGIPREELRSRLRLTSSTFNLLLRELITNNRVESDGSSVKLTEHEIRFSVEDQHKIDELMKAFNEQGVNSPSVKVARNLVGDDLYRALIDVGDLTPVTQEVVYRTADYDHFVRLIIDYLKVNQRINAGELRDLLNTSRKYAIAILEHLDDQGTTRRVGDDRILVNKIEEL